MTLIQARVDRKRGCGWRSPGGLYLVAEGPTHPCGLLPIELTDCPTCGAGIKATRSWQWINPRPFVAKRLRDLHGGEPPIHALSDGGMAQPCTMEACTFCYMDWGDRCGLLWIGGQFYATPDDWTKEAIAQGVSRRITAVPNDFELGKTWCLVAHRALRIEECVACAGTGNYAGGPGCERCESAGKVQIRGIFHAFKPQAIEYVVRGDETTEALERMLKRGITPVRVIRDETGGAL